MKNSFFLVTILLPDGTSDVGLVYAMTTDHACQIARRVAGEGSRVLDCHRASPNELKHHISLVDALREK